MTSTLIPKETSTPGGRDLRDARADYFFKLLLTAAVAFVLIALVSAALSMLWEDAKHCNCKASAFSIARNGTP